MKKKLLNNKSTFDHNFLHLPNRIRDVRYDMNLARTNEYIIFRERAMYSDSSSRRPVRSHENVDRAHYAP